MPLNNPKSFDCVAAAEHLHEFLDGELKPDLHAAMNQHLASCADCAATLAQLRQIDNAHRQLDTQLQLPPEAYWQALPHRVMERVKASERRHLLALPKLSRLKSAVKQVPAHKQMPQNELLYLSPVVRKFLRGARYVLPLAAVAAFCFFLIRELREKPEASMMTTSAPQRQMAETKSTRDESVLEKPLASVPAPIAIAESPTKRNSAGLKTFQPSSNEKEALLQDTVGGATAGGQGVGLTLKSAERSLDMATPVVPKTEESTALKLQSGETDAEEVAAESTELQNFAEAKNQPVAPAENAVINYQRGTAAKTTAAKSRDDRLVKSAAAPEGRLSLMQARSSSNLGNNIYVETFQLAQQTADLKKREKIWRSFLASNPDSAHRALAITQLAQTLIAASDSASTVEHLTQSFAFFIENATILRSQMGAAQYDRELNRLQELLKIRRNVSNKRP